MTVTTPLESDYPGTGALPASRVGTLRASWPVGASPSRLGCAAALLGADVAAYALAVTLAATLVWWTDAPQMLLAWPWQQATLYRASLPGAVLAAGSTLLFPSR